MFDLERPHEIQANFLEWWIWCYPHFRKDSHLLFHWLLKSRLTGDAFGSYGPDLLHTVDNPYFLPQLGESMLGSGMRFCMVNETDVHS